MAGNNRADDSSFGGQGELQSFRSIHWLHNHWSRSTGPRAYYWYLTFENSPELRFIARECQKAIAFPYYDLTPPTGLHLTLDRIASESDITPNQLRALRSAAMRACRQVPPFQINIASLAVTPGAIGFNVSMSKAIQEVRDTLRLATLSVCPEAPVKDSGFHPHVTIAYANSDGVPAADAVAAAEKLSADVRVDVAIEYGALVVLERRRRSYEWQLISRIPLAG